MPEVLPEHGAFSLVMSEDAGELASGIVCQLKHAAILPRPIERGLRIITMMLFQQDECCGQSR